MKIFKSLKRFSIWLFGFKCKEGIVSKDEFYNIRNFLFDQNKLIINSIITTIDDYYQKYDCYKLEIIVSKFSRQGKFFGSGIIENLN